MISDPPLKAGAIQARPAVLAEVSAGSFYKLVGSSGIYAARIETSSELAL